MPSDSNVFASVMELMVFGHRNRTVIIPFDENREFLRIAKFFKKVSKRSGANESLGV